jgi:hypothetical protein
VKHFFINHGMLGMSQLPHCLKPANFFVISKANTNLKEEDLDAENIIKFM